MSWSRVPLKHLGSVILGKMIQPEPGDSSDVVAPYLRAAHVQPRGQLVEVDDKTMWFKSNELGQLDLRQGDVVVVEGGAGYGRSAVLREDREGWGFQNSIVRIRPKNDVAIGRFLDYALQSALQTGAIEIACFTATIPHFTADKVAAFLLPAPPVCEQWAIADFLDRETARIDTLIQEQQRLKDLLDQRKAAVVDEALALGLSSRAGLSATGDPWLPALPQGWKAVRAKYLLSYGPANGVSPEPSQSDELKSLSLGSVRGGRVRLSPEVTKFVESRGMANVDSYRLLPGDVLLVRGNGNVNLVARAGLVGAEAAEERFIYPDLLVRIRTNASMLPEFFVLAVNASTTRAQIRAKARTAVGTFKVSGDDIRSLVLPRPPLAEQSDIVRHAVGQTAKIDALIAETERFIELSKERRAALITAAVTGQIDVREVA